MRRLRVKNEAHSEYLIPHLTGVHAAALHSFMPSNLRSTFCDKMPKLLQPNMSLFMPDYSSSHVDGNGEVVDVQKLYLFMPHGSDVGTLIQFRQRGNSMHKPIRAEDCRRLDASIWLPLSFLVAAHGTDIGRVG